MELSQTRGALSRQTRPADEIITINDAMRRGPSWARNEGIRRATGDLIAFTDDDCVPPEDWLESLIGAIERYAAAGAGGTYREEDPFLHEVRMRRDIPDHELVDTEGHVGTGGNVMYVRRVLDECDVRDGYVFSDTRPLSEDIELAWRLRRRGAKLVYVPTYVRHLRRMTFWRYLPFQFKRGMSIAALEAMQRQQRSTVAIQRGRLWYRHDSSLVRYARSFWYSVLGPFDVGSFSRPSFFIRFWMGEKCKALGFAWGTVRIACRGGYRDASTKEV
jgi:GT2 family glycosyltransferase